MKTAALDLGSNSFLCLISELNEEGVFDVLEDLSIITRLGQNIQKQGKITKESLLRAAQAFSQFKELIDKHRVTSIQAVTTAAAREASNFSELESLGLQYGIPINLISGEEEARLSFDGAVSNKEASSSLLLDIGGGSTEMAYFEEGSDKLFLRSLPLGSVRLGEMFVSDWEKLGKAELFKIKEQILKTLDLSWGSDRPPKKSWVAVAGTPTTLKAIQVGGYDDAKINESTMTIEEIKDVEALILSHDLKERRKIPGLQPKRADVIPVGAIILEVLMEWAGVKEVKISTRGLRYGLAKSIS